MSDITWRDTYNDAEGLAGALDEIEQWLINEGRYSDATDVHWAAHVLREQAEQEAELLAPTPAPEGEAQPAGLHYLGRYGVVQTGGEWWPHNLPVCDERVMDPGDGSHVHIYASLAALPASTPAPEGLPRPMIPQEEVEQALKVLAENMTGSNPAKVRQIGEVLLAESVSAFPLPDQEGGE